MGFPISHCLTIPASKLQVPSIKGISHKADRGNDCDHHREVAEGSKVLSHGGGKGMLQVAPQNSCLLGRWVLFVCSESIFPVVLKTVVLVSFKGNYVLQAACVV